jgi:hypothetical protein
MKIRPCLFAGAVFALIGPLNAGTLQLQPKESAPPTITESQPWQFTIAAPGWMAGMNGTIGINGHDADIDLGLGEILQHLDMIFAMRVEAQKGPFGIFGEFIYLAVSDGAQTSGLIDNIAAQVRTSYADGALSWRLINTPRWSLDFAAGTHYANVFEKLILNSNPVAIQQASERFVDDIADDLRDRLNQDISKSEFLEILKSTIAENIANRIGNALDRFENKPSIPIGPLGGRIRERVAQRVENFIEAKRIVLKDRIDALHLKGEARRVAVGRAVNAAKARLANQLAIGLNRTLSQTLSRDDWWFDPCVGLRTRFNFNKTFYTAVRGEIGGFGVSADLMWQAEGVLGINLTRNMFTEIGYRALSVDYDQDGLLLDTVTHGPQITTGITF